MHNRSNTAIRHFTLEVAELSRHGRGLRRPENVLGFRDGTVFASSNGGYVTRIDPDERQWQIGAIEGAEPTTMALESEDALIVNDTSDGNLHRLRFDGTYEDYLSAIDGEPIGSANYVFRDRRDRIWIAVATRRRPPHRSAPIAADGYVALLEGRTARIVADGLRWPNEVRLDAEERYAYVPETFGQRVLRYPVTAAGLGEPEPFGPDPLGETAIPDGIALGADGSVWVAILSRNGLMVIEPDGEAHTVFEQPVPAALEELKAAYEQGTVPRPLIGACGGPDLALLTSVGFAGPQLRTVVMGSLAMDRLVSFKSPVPGLPLFHQNRPYAPPMPPGAQPVG